MNAPRDLINQRFGRLNVIEPAYSRKGQRYWKCLCDCGGTAIVLTCNLTSGNSQSCGCQKWRGCRKTHGKTRTSIYGIWCAMRSRCFNPNSPAYRNYGGRGIKVCERWLVFENFYADVGVPPNGLTLDRIDNDSDYGPHNFRWATGSQQSLNRRPYKHFRNTRRYANESTLASSD